MENEENGHKSHTRININFLNAILMSVMSESNTIRLLTARKTLAVSLKQQVPQSQAVSFEGEKYYRVINISTNVFNNKNNSSRANNINSVANQA